VRYEVFPLYFNIFFVQHASAGVVEEAGVVSPRRGVVNQRIPKIDRGILPYEDILSNQPVEQFGSTGYRIEAAQNKVPEFVPVELLNDVIHKGRDSSLLPREIVLNNELAALPEGNETTGPAKQA